MKNKNFTTKTNVFVSKSYIAFMFLFVFFTLQNVSAQTADCPLSSNDLVQVSLNDNCEAIVTPEMIIEGENDNVVCGYKIYKIFDNNNVTVGHAEAGTGNWVLSGTYNDQILTAEVGFDPGNGNVTWGKLYLEDKIPPTLRCLDTVYVSCAADLSDYLTTSTNHMYTYIGAQPVVPSVGANVSEFPFNIPANGNVEIPFDVVNEANQSEIMNYVQAVLSLSTNSNITVEFEGPTGASPNTVSSPYRDDYVYEQQATDPFISGTWTMRILNGNGYTVRVVDAKLRIKSTSFLTIGNGVIADDNCHVNDITINVLSDFTKANDVMCGDYFQERKIKYQATDWKGMKSPICEHVIRWEHKGFADLDWPSNWDGLDESPLSCTGKFMQEDNSGDLSETNVIWDTNGDGYPQAEELDVPSIDGNPIYPDPLYCMINVSYKDEVFDICPGSFKILRKWIAYDMCEPGQDGVNPSTHYQIIKVVDINPTSFDTNNSNSITVSADPFNCSSDAVLPVPTIIDYGCSKGYTYEVGYCATGNGIFEYFDNITSRTVVKDGVKTKEYTIKDLPLGETCVRYVLTDLCGNKSYGTLKVIVEDDVAPIPICDEHTVVTVTSDCTARVNATTFDDGSFDNCSEVTFRVARMFGSSIGTFREYVDFNGSDVGSTRQVVLKVIDEEDNWNTCMVDVTIDNKIKARINCPKPFTVDCGTDYETVTGKGEPTVIYNCTYTLEGPTYSGTLNQCGVGNVYKKWEVKVGGNVVTSCSQRIRVLNKTPFKMFSGYWPRNVTNLVGCSDADTDPSNTGEPNLSADDACSMVASTHVDRKFNVVQDACYKILRDWTVIDWCQYNDSNPVPIFGQQGHPYVGMWTYTQVIMVNDNNAPVITSSCANQTICAYNSNCTGDVVLEAEADDTCTPDSELAWTYRVEDIDGNYIASGTKSKFEKLNMALGTYHIYWTVEDKCGNIDECDYSFKVKDCKKPTPLCYSEITTVVMPSTDPRMVVVKARDFDRGSTDNCDAGATCGECDTDLRFSFSGDYVTQTEKTFTEAHVGIQTLEMWVWDKAGNRDFCTVTLHVQDNVDGGAIIAGKIVTEDEKVVEHAGVEVEDMLLHETKGTTSNASGFFEFSVVGNSDYAINASMNDDYLNGLTTLDLVIIQKHILKIKNIKSPYKLLAADANQDKKVSAGDILALRKLILGSTNKLKEVDAWTFVDGDVEFSNPNNPWFGNEGMNTILLERVLENKMNNKFIALKMGDVNNSALVNSSSNMIQPRSVMNLNIDNVTFNAGDVVKVPVYASSFEDIAGMQFSIRFNNENLEMMNIEAGKMSITKSNYTVHDDIIYMSWNSMKGHTYNEDEILFTIEYAAKKAGQLVDQIGVVNKISAEAYNNDLEVYGMELNFRNLDQGEFTLYQNTPNPFSNETEIAFDLPESGIVTTTVYDVTGKVIVQNSRNFEKGKNSVKMSKNDLKNVSGVLYYKVEYNGNVAIKKMVLLTK